LAYLSIVESKKNRNVESARQFVSTDLDGTYRLIMNSVIFFQLLREDYH